MTRLVLSVSVSSAVLGLGLWAALVQSRNFDRAARLDRLQHEAEWYARRSSGLQERVERLEFALRVAQNRALEQGHAERMEGRD